MDPHGSERDVSKEYPVNADVLQGSVLGPTHILLCINTHDPTCNIAIYADNTILYS